MLVGLGSSFSEYAILGGHVAALRDKPHEHADLTSIRPNTTSIASKNMEAVRILSPFSSFLESSAC